MWRDKVQLQYQEVANIFPFSFLYSPTGSPCERAIANLNLSRGHLAPVNLARTKVSRRHRQFHLEVNHICIMLEHHVCVRGGGGGLPQTRRSCDQINMPYGGGESVHWAFSMQLMYSRFDLEL